MTKWFAKWLRKFHRWIAIPTAIAIPAVLIIKLVGNTKLMEAWEKIEKVPSLLMLIMALSGAYLFLIPYIAKGQRKKRLADPK